jgi:hypothetical protein
MSNYGAIAFAAVYASLPDCRCQIRVDRRKVIPQALLASVGSERISTDQGMAVTSDVNVRLPISTVPANKLRMDDQIEVSRDDAATWQSYKILSRVETAGLLRIELTEVPHGR